MQLLVHRLKFAATLTAPGCARVFVGHTLTSWLLPNLVHNAELIVSELVTNAVRATGITALDPTYADLEGLALVAVQVRVSGESLFIEVWDDDREKPGHPSADIDPDERGRGLIIVAALSKHHGISRYKGGGKVVWAELDAGAEIVGMGGITVRGSGRTEGLVGATATDLTITRHGGIDDACAGDRAGPMELADGGPPPAWWPPAGSPRP